MTDDKKTRRLYLWFFCNHHAAWERVAENPCFLSHTDAPPTGRMPTAWKTCTSCLIQKPELTSERCLEGEMPEAIPAA